MMKKKTICILSFGVLLFNLLINACAVSAFDISNKTIAATTDDFYYVLENDQAITQRTWSKTQNYKIKNGTRTYLGTKTLGRDTSISIVIPTKVGNITIKQSFSKSGKFKTYKQCVKVTVTYKRYRKVDNAYVDTQTITANTSYIDYIAI